MFYEFGFSLVQFVVAVQICWFYFSRFSTIEVMQDHVHDMLLAKPDPCWNLSGMLKCTLYVILYVKFGICMKASNVWYEGINCHITALR